MTDVQRRRRLAVGALVALALLGVVALFLALRGDDAAGPSTGAAALVPADALVYVHLSTDPDRGGVAEAQRLAENFPSFKRLRETVLTRLAVGDGAGVQEWLGDEVALALTNSATNTAGSLVVLSVGDRKKAEEFVRRGATSSGPSTEYRGVTLQRYGAVVAAFIDDYLVLGQPVSVRKAVDLDQGRGAGLADAKDYKDAMKGAPEDRVADAYVTGGGVERLLAPSGGVLGAAGVLLARPGLKATGLALSATEGGADLRVHSLSTPPKGQAGFTPFEPKLLDAVPKGALAYLGVSGLDKAGGRLASVAGTTGLGGLVIAAQSALGGRNAADLLKILGDEAALVILPGLPAPTLVVIADAGDEARTKRATTQLFAGLRKAIKGAKVTTAGGVTTLRGPNGAFQLFAAVAEGRLVLATARTGIDAARRPDGGISDAESFAETVGDPQGKVSSVVFLDFSQLLKLGEQTGLSASPAYQAVREDLAAVKAIGASSSGGGGDSTAEIRFQIP